MEISSIFEHVDMNHQRMMTFIEVLTKLRLFCRNNIGDFCDEKWNFPKLKKLSFDMFTFKANFRGNSKIFNQLEDIHIEQCRIDEKAFALLISLIPNVKRLSLLNITTNYPWYSQTYPSLTSCFIQPNYGHVVPFATFLELNPNIRTFEIDLFNLWENRELLKKAKIELDTLVVCIGSKQVSIEFVNFCLLLNELYEIGHFKQLKIHISETAEVSPNLIESDDRIAWTR